MKLNIVKVEVLPSLNRKKGTSRHGRSQDFSQGVGKFFLYKWKHIHLKKLVLVVSGPGFIDNNNIR